MAEKKRSFKVYSAWNYEKEIEDLNKASEEGWQLIRGGCFSSLFEKNENIRYRYQLDYRKVDDPARYIETFREQGWEYINSTFNGWHYLRKLYDPSLPEEEYEIFTDRESLHEMNNRWARFALILGIFIGIFAVISLVRMIQEPRLPILAQLLTFAIESAVLIRGSLIMRNPDSSRNRRGDGFLLSCFFIVIILGCVSNIYLTEKRPHFHSWSSAGSIEEPVENEDWSGFKVDYRDNYYLDLKIKAEKPITVKILDAKGQTVFSEQAAELNKKNQKLPLSKGEYKLTLSAESGYNFDVKID